MTPEQRTTFRIFAATSMILMTGCEVVRPLHASSDGSKIEPIPLSSPLPTNHAFSTEDFVTFTPTPQLIETPMLPISVTSEVLTSTPFLEPFTVSLESPIRLDKENTTYLTLKLGETNAEISFVPRKWNEKVEDFKTLCPVGKEYACTFSSDNRTFVFIDSGWFDDKPLAAEPIRNYFEGGYPMRAAEERKKRLESMVGESITLRQYNGSWTGEVLAAVYIPPDQKDAFTADLAHGPDFILSLYPEYTDAIKNGIVYIEFCGWDKSLKGNDRWVASRYVLILGNPTKNPQ